MAELESFDKTCSIGLISPTKKTLVLDLAYTELRALLWCGLMCDDTLRHLVKVAFNEIYHECAGHIQRNRVAAKAGGSDPSTNSNGSR